MAVSYVGVSTAVTANNRNSATANASKALTLPANIAAGDLLLLSVIALVPTSTFSLPSQWQKVDQGALPNNKGVYGLYWARQGIDAGSISYSLPQYGIIYARVLAYRGASTAYDPPWESYSSNDGDFTTNTNPYTGFKTPAVAANSAGSMVAAIATFWSNSGNTFTPPSGWTERLDASTSVNDYLVSYAAESAASAAKTVPAASFAPSGSLGWGHVFTFSIFADGSAPGSTAPTKGSINVNVGGTWKQAQSLWVNSAGTWKQAQSVFTNVGGTWKQVL
ncbi:hypothetical protein [Methylobacterium sp. SD21]|uniref:hypothetical protein n=1 Tax=Methylobacterium litchii TaxID=3138810 RepID=UPI00313CF92B